MEMRLSLAHFNFLRIMSDQDYSAPINLPIIGRSGVTDNNPITQTRAWFKINGCVAIGGLLLRLNGKRLSFKLNDPVLIIHSNNIGQVFIQTISQILMIKESDLLFPEVIDDVDSSVVMDDIAGVHVLAG